MKTKLRIRNIMENKNYICRPKISQFDNKKN